MKTAKEILELFTSDDRNAVSRLAAIAAIQYALDGRNDDNGKMLLTPDLVVNTVKDYIKGDPFAKSRKKLHVQARQIVMYILYTNCYYTYAAIGNLFDQDHTTIIYGVRIFASLIDHDSYYRDIYNKVVDKLSIHPNNLNAERKIKLRPIHLEQKKQRHTTKQFLMPDIVARASANVLAGDPYSPLKTDANVITRSCAMYILYTHSYHTLKGIANIFHKHHTTIMYSIETFKELMNKNPNILAAYTKVVETIGVVPYIKSKLTVKS